EKMARQQDNSDDDSTIGYGEEEFLKLTQPFLSFRVTEWLCHTNFSFLAASSHPSELFNRAKELGISGVAVTDYDGVYGLARSYRHWRDMDQSTRPALIYGAEIHLTPDHDLPITLQNTAAFIAKNARGYQNLCKIITHSHRNGKYNAFISIEDLANHDVTDLAVIIPMRGLIRSRKMKLWHQQMSRLKEISPKGLHFVISRHLNPAEDTWIPIQLEAAKRYDANILLSQDVFFHDPSRKPLNDVLHAIRTNKTLESCVHQMFVNDQRTFICPQEFHSRYKELTCYNDAMHASEVLLEQCHFSFKELSYRYPKEMLPEGHTAQSYLIHLTWEGLARIYHDNPPDSVRNLIVHELALIEHLGFADYFITVWDIVRWARNQNILCQGRGSAANSAVCFVLGITAVDPSKFDLLFERFMSVERGDPPDIDIDFENERREEVIQYIYHRYGRDRAAMVANVITFRKKGSFREVGKALGIPEVILGRTAEHLGSRVNAGKSLTEITAALQTESPTEQDVPWALWAELANSLRGFPRHLGIHSGGFMIADRPLTALVPYEPASMAGRSVIQWSKDDIEDLGFFKIDILALGMLTAVRKMLQLLHKHYNIDLSLASIPQEDKATYEMIQRADTIGTFQIESRAQMSMLPRMLPKTFYDLVIEVAIIRPGPIQGGMIHPFLRRRNGLEAITYPDQRLKPILDRTLGIPIFQEQVMRIAMAVGNFNPGEANELRKNMGAWSLKGDINPWLIKLAEGLRMNKISPEFSEAIIAQMRGFAEYGFPESHSVSFALIAYASSYLKCHYPAVFFTSILNSQPMGFYAPHTLIHTARRLGVEVLPISVNHSSWDSTLECGHPGSPNGIGMRLGFRLMSGFRAEAAKAIEAARSKHGAWSSWQDFLKQTNLYRRDLTTLAAADALHPLGIDRRSAIWIAAATPHSNWLEDVEAPFDFMPETDHEKVQQDFHATGTSLHAHPTQLVRDSMWCYPIAVTKLKSATDLEGLIPNQQILVFGMITIVQRPPSAKGMMFITIEDHSGYMNLVLRPDIIDKFATILTGASMLCIRGKLQKQGAAHSILVQEVFMPKVSEGEVLTLQHRQREEFGLKDEAPFLESYIS
ncbi:MAG: error-prone DNA polymerase, partial [Proteobacteria bacterium]|nr:error-prone DNA polymerase [Pseudomonadota bacterium]